MGVNSLPSADKGSSHVGSSRSQKREDLLRGKGTKTTDSHGASWAPPLKNHPLPHTQSSWRRLWLRVEGWGVELALAEKLSCVLHWARPLSIFPNEEAEAPWYEGVCLGAHGTRGEAGACSHAFIQGSPPPHLAPGAPVKQVGVSPLFCEPWD